VGGEIYCALGIYFIFIPQFTIINVPIDTKKLRRFYTPLRTGQCRYDSFCAIYKGAEISSRLLQVKTMDDDPKKFIPQLAIDTEFFHCAFVNCCTM
jgi:hypothetical protein